MAAVLDKKQCDRIKDIRKQIRELDIENWLCEGGPEAGLNQFFNNDTEGFFLADYDGNIIESNMAHMTEDLKEYSRLEGQICRICGYEEYKGGCEEYER